MNLVGKTMLPLGGLTLVILTLILPVGREK